MCSLKAPIAFIRNCFEKFGGLGPTVVVTLHHITCTIMWLELRTTHESTKSREGGGNYSLICPSSH